MITFTQISKMETLNANSIILRNHIHDSIITDWVVNSKEVFDSIYSVGKDMLNYVFNRYKNDINNGYTLDDLFLRICDDLKEPIINIYNQWINYNSYPYSRQHYKEFNSLSFTHFVNDILFLSATYELFVWTNKLSSIAKEVITADTFSKFTMLLTFINAKDIIRTDATNWIDVYNVDYNLEKEQLLLTNLTDSIKNKKAQLFSSVRRIVVSAINNKINTQHEFYISRHTATYIKELDTYHILNSANSLMGIAYYQLLLNITAFQYEFKEKICKNPSCINFFEATGNQRYCRDCIKKGIPNILKNRKYNNSPRGIKVRKKYHKRSSKSKRSQ